MRRSVGPGRQEREHRTTWLLFRTATLRQLNRTLKRLGGARVSFGARAWTFEVPGIRPIRAYVVGDICSWENDLSLDSLREWWWPLTHALGSEPTCAVSVTNEAVPEAESRCALLIQDILLAHSGIAARDAESPPAADLRPGTEGNEFDR